MLKYVNHNEAVKIELTVPGHLAGAGVGVRQPPRVQYLRPLLGMLMTWSSHRANRTELMMIV